MSGVSIAVCEALVTDAKKFLRCRQIQNVSPKLVIWLLCTCSHYLQMSELFTIISKTSMPTVTTLNLLFGNAFINFQFLSLRYGHFSGIQHTPKPVQQLYVHWTCHTRDDYEGRLYSHHDFRLLL